MVDLTILEEKGVSAEAWRAKLEKRSKENKGPIRDAVPVTQDEKLDSLINRIRSRIQNEREYNLNHWRRFHVLDLIYDTPDRQVTPTLISTICDRCKTEQEVMDMLKLYGMNMDSVVVETLPRDGKTTDTRKVISAPAFFGVTIPLVRAYLQARQAKLVNDRNLKPFIQYEPAYNNPADRIRCEVISSAIDTMATQFNYLEVLNQAILRMLLYTRAWIFPREEWYKESQLRRVDKREKEIKDAEDNGEVPTPQPDLSNPAGPNTGIFEQTTGPEASELTIEEYVTKEGVRFSLPHPTRTYWDKAFPAKSINTDTGCRYVGHWQVVRYREILETEGWYNKDQIYWGSNQWWDTASHFFATVYNTCTLKWPRVVGEPPDDMDREVWLAENSTYNQDHMDSAVFLCHHFEKFNPKECGLGDYDYDIWGRFVVAGDGSIMYAAPCGYTPGICMEDNTDDKRLEDASMGLRLAPFQDMLSNITSQYLLSVKQNLANITLLDKNVFEDKTIIQKLRNRGEGLFRELNIYEFDSKRLVKAGLGTAQAIYSHRFPYLDVNGQLTALRLVLDLAERVMQFSSQELAQSATHEQTRAEVEILSATTGNILAYTSIPVDLGMMAMAKLVYAAKMNYGEDDFMVEIPTRHGLTKDAIAALGFSVLEEPKMAGEKFKVRVPDKTALMLMQFAVVPDPFKRVTNLAAAGTMSNFIRDLFNNPITANAIGPDQAIALANQIAIMAGIRLDKPLVNTGMTQEQQALQSRQFLQQIVNEVLQAADQKIQPIKVTVDQIVKALHLQDVVSGTEANTVNGSGQGENPQVGQLLGGRSIPATTEG